MNLHTHASDLLNQLSKRAISEFEEHERTLMAVHELEAQVNNGGFDQFYDNRSGDLANITPEALRAIGAHRTADIVETANAVFGASVPTEWSKRQDIHQALVDQEACEEIWEQCDTDFYRYDDDIEALLQAYWHKKSPAKKRGFLKLLNAWLSGRGSG